MFHISQSGNFNNAIKFLKDGLKIDNSVLKRYGEIGVSLLKKNTPVDTGATASAWSFKTSTDNKGNQIINFYNSSQDQGVPITILLQYGHATKSGGWVEGKDYINPAMDELVKIVEKEMWKK